MSKKNQSRMAQLANQEEEKNPSEQTDKNEFKEDQPEINPPNPPQPTYTKEEWDLYLKTWEAGLANIFQYAPIGSVTQKRHFIKQCLHQNLILCDLMIQQYRELNGSEGVSYEPNLE